MDDHGHGHDAYELSRAQVILGSALGLIELTCEEDGEGQENSGSRGNGGSCSRRLPSCRRHPSHPAPDQSREKSQASKGKASSARCVDLMLHRWPYLYVRPLPCVLLGSHARMDWRMIDEWRI